ncbi:MAG: hypothetical protein O2954_10465 [bacterium]|nr:hypothetical protein [bacterium]
MKTLTKKNYPYQAAGKVWTVPELHLERLPDGTVVILEEEILRIHRAIANELCGTPNNLSGEEMEFLCDVTGTSFSDIADYLGIHRSTLTKWRKAGETPKNVMSLVLKKWFWLRLFGAKLGNRTVQIKHLQDEEHFLLFAKARAIESNLTEPIQTMKA